MDHAPAPMTLDGRSVAARMDQDGFAVIPNFVPSEQIADASKFVQNQLKRHHGEYFTYRGNEALANSVLAKIGNSPALRTVMADVYESAVGKPAPDEGVYQVLRVVAGKTGVEQAYRFHYDAYVVTALLPIMIPEGPAQLQGNLILYPKVRRVRSSVLLNLGEKLLMQNGLTRWMAARPFTRRTFGAKVLAFEPGSLYLFWGYQSLHANEPCTTAAVRATALYHFVDPHRGALTTRTIEARRQRKEAQIRRNLLLQSRLRRAP
jgi:hypothetical protein